MAALHVWKVLPGKMQYPLQIEVSDSWKSLDDVSEALPGGAYTTFRTYEGVKAINFADHVCRLERTAHLSGHNINLDESIIRSICHEIIHSVPFAEKRIRVTLDLEMEPGTLYFVLEELKLPPLTAYQKGVKVITRRLERANPQAKLTNFIPTAAKLRSEMPQDVHEVIMVDGMDHLLEGLSSNFYVVFRGQLWTAGEGVLLGVTRKMVLECAALLEIPVRLEAQHISDLANFEEAFITSVSRDVLPVSQINECVISGGEVGPITHQIMRAFDQRVKREAEII